MAACIHILTTLTVTLAAVHVSAASLSRREADQALRRSVAFFRQQVAAEGGYLWRYSADLTLREGEGKATASTAWVQPPGTPSVGTAYLEAYQRTGDRYLLDAARETAHALVRGQLRSGGWDYRIEFSPEARQRYAYRVDGDSGQKRNTTTLDDNTTQAALRFLMQLDAQLGFEDELIHEAAVFALDSLLKAQYLNGAWPQRYNRFPDPVDHPVLPASYPDSWSRIHPKQDYRDYYTFNDNTIADMVRLFFDAAEVYGEVSYRSAAEIGGDFILLAQMPDPQPAWAQQYNAQMQPAWARRFEPPAITGGESQRILYTLLELYRRTGKRKYLEPVPRALDYLKRSRLEDGRLARFYELQTNKPLYFTRQYELTYRSDDSPAHYAFIVRSKLDAIGREYAKLSTGPWRAPKRRATSRAVRMSRSLAARARAVVESMDERGAWVETGKLKSHKDADVKRIITCETFIENVGILSRFLAASGSQ